jgi:thiamine pyrophosphate-dependent acetolactate synthase large subunit-like protein
LLAGGLQSLSEAVELLSSAKKPVIVSGNFHDL